MKTIKYDGLEFNVSEFRAEATQIAKRLDISMTLVTEDLIEFFETDTEKALRFAEEIKILNKDTRVIELISNNQNADIRGNKLQGKALYLVDEEYYRSIVGEPVTEQLSLFNA